MAARFEPTPESGPLEGQLHERMSFEALLWDISAIFLTVPATEVSSKLKQSLKRIADALKLDRATVLKFSKDLQQIWLIHSYTQSDLMEPDIESLDQNLP